MGKDEGQTEGILAYISIDKNRYLGGSPLSLLAKDEKELESIYTSIAEAYLANILQLPNGDHVVIKKN
jgi:hypothetical protein